MQIKAIFNRLDEARRQQIGEVLRFVIVGVAATLLQYGIYSALILLIRSDASAAQAQLFSTAAMTVGYAISFVFNFVASTRYTLNLFLWLGMSRQLAPVPMFGICVPINFLLVRFFLKR